MTTVKGSETTAALAEMASRNSSCASARAVESDSSEAAMLRNAARSALGSAWKAGSLDASLSETYLTAIRERVQDVVSVKNGGAGGLTVLEA